MSINSKLLHILIVFLCGVSLAEANLTNAFFIRHRNSTTSTKIEIPFSSDGKPSKVYLHGEPTNQEQYMLELINRARANPLAEIKRILSANDKEVARAMETYKITEAELISEFSEYQPAPPLAFNPELISSARTHAQDMADNDFQGHTGSDGSTVGERLTEAGYKYLTAGENVFSYAYSVDYAHAAFLIDWGVDSLGHRKNELGLIPDSDFREIGIAVVAENDPATSVGPLVITEDFGKSYDGVVFIAGVVYRDENNNGFYDPGEGLEDVKIIPDHGTYYAQTSASGGYAIPVLINSGIYHLRTERSDLPEMQASANIGEQNVKVDFVLGDPRYASIEGEVVDKDTDKPISGVIITLKPINAQYTTDADGKFIFSDLPAANYILSAELSGYSFKPNDFGIALASGQKFRIKLQASEENASPPSAEAISSNGMCSGLGTIILLMMFCGFRLIACKE